MRVVRCRVRCTSAAWNALRGSREAVVHVSTFFMGGNKLVVVPIEKLGILNLEWHMR